METLKQFTCITYDNTDFLIPCEYIVAGLYIDIKEDTKVIIYNRETLPLLQIGTLIKKEFFCNFQSDVTTILVMQKKDFVKDVCKEISDYTDTAFPASGYLALSVIGEIRSITLETNEIKPIPEGIRERMVSCGVCGIRFTNDGRKQLLISPDLLIRKFFTGALI